LPTFLKVGNDLVLANMARINPHLKQALISGPVYGAGLLIGMVAMQLIGSGISPELFLIGGQGLRLAQGILLAFVIAGIGGFFGGFAGGWTLPVVARPKGRWGYAWQSGFTFAVGIGILIFPVLLIISLLSFYEIPTIPARVFGLVFGIVGLVFGLIAGGVLGIWTLRRFVARITWASALGFALGGAGLGYGLWRYLLSVTAGQLHTGSINWLVFGTILFGALGGAGLGAAYYRTADQFSDGALPTHRSKKKRWYRLVVIVGAALFLLTILIRPMVAAVGDLLTPVDAALSPLLDLQTTGTHWLDARQLTTGAIEPALFAGQGGQLALAWVEESHVVMTTGQWSGENQSTEWQQPVQISELQDPVRSEPQIVLDGDGRSHLAWIEAVEGGGEAVLTSRCEDGLCSEPVVVSAEAASGCARPPVPGNRHPTLAINDRGSVVLVWENESGMLPFALWPAEGEAPQVANGCVPTPEARGGSQPRIVSGPESDFTLVFSSSTGDTFSSQYAGGEWDSEPLLLGSGQFPSVFVDDNNVRHASWCDGDGVIYWNDGRTESVAPVSCQSRPELGMDENERVHIVWFADEVENNSGQTNMAEVLYESVQLAGDWTTPAVVAQVGRATQPVMASAKDGSLHLAWSGLDQLSYAAQVQYQCDGDDLSSLGQIVYDVGRQERYIPVEDPVPYCQNRYDQLIITPNPAPEYSDQMPTPNGAFDLVADLIRTAEYEVLFSTMWYAEAANNDSPGSVVATGVADLYQNLKAHPEQYPRGITVRILLDNPPEMARGEATGQLWSLLGDLRHAGIDRMVDPAIGWRLEVADYEGNMPHSHVKSVIVDGKTAVAAGFNMTYDHFPKDHVSGKGNDRFDLALQVTGPVAQSALRMFDDMWIGADERYCLSFDPPLGIPWQVTCFDRSAEGDHAPEVLKFYLPGDDDHAFSLYRSKVHDAADIQTVDALRSAQESLDIIQVNFSLDLVCNLNILFDICSAEISPDYMPALIEAAENGAKVRALVKPSPFEGIENNVALDALDSRMRELGLEDQVEIRFYDGPMHPKAALIDEQMLIVGSQNFHYSAFGSGGGLNEYSFAVENDKAAEDFSRAFEFLWEQTEPRSQTANN
jgi:phosphatidylserine/phosphatidylglycerophosphate/cardiolipin synthase-like enzyme